MFKKIVWNDDFETGIQEIDKQHQNIIEAVNRLCCSVEKNKDKDEIKAALEQFDYYVSVHFETEEKYMEKYNFEHILEHKDAHGFCRKMYNEIRYNYFYVDEQDMPKEKLLHTYSIHLSNTLGDWLKLHFTGIDKVLAEFLRNKKG